MPGKPITQLLLVEFNDEAFKLVRLDSPELRAFCVTENLSSKPLFWSISVTIGWFQKISIPIPRAASRNS